MKLGDFLVVYFSDHSMADGAEAQPVHCRVAGWLLADEPTHLTIEAWQILGPTDMKENRTTFTIIKQPGTKVRRAKIL